MQALLLRLALDRYGEVSEVDQVLRQTDARRLAEALGDEEPDDRVIVRAQRLPEPALLVGAEFPDALGRLLQLEIGPWELVEVARHLPHPLCASEHAPERLDDLAVDGGVGDELARALAVLRANHLLGRAASDCIRDVRCVDLHEEPVTADEPGDVP